MTAPSRPKSTRADSFASNEIAVDPPPIARSSTLPSKTSALADAGLLHLDAEFRAEIGDLGRRSANDEKGEAAGEGERGEGREEREITIADC